METALTHQPTAEQQNGEDQPSPMNESLISENAKLRAENARLNTKLALSEQRVIELEREISGQRADLDKMGFVNCFEQGGNQRSESDQARTIRQLQNLVDEERRQKMELENELKELKDSLGGASYKCINGDEVQLNLLRLKEQFDELSKYMQIQHENDEEEVMSLATKIKERNQRLQNLIQRLNPQKLTRLVEPRAKKSRNDAGSIAPKIEMESADDDDSSLFGN